MTHKRMRVWRGDCQEGRKVKVDFASTTRRGRGVDLHLGFRASADDARSCAEKRRQPHSPNAPKRADAWEPASSRGGPSSLCPPHAPSTDPDPRHNGRAAHVTTESRKLAAILAADVVGFSRLAGATEERTLARLRALRSDHRHPPRPRGQAHRRWRAGRIPQRR